jgi:hypothetical protein
VSATEQDAARGGGHAGSVRAAALYGLLAEFDQANALLEAVRRARAAGFTRLEAYSPFSIEGIDEAIGMRRNHIPLLTLAGGFAGGAVGFFIQWYSATINYPINVGGRPLDSWPSFMPTTFEFAVLAAGFAAVFGVLLLSGLPRLMHPLFNVEAFARATLDRFFLLIRTDDARFHRVQTAEFLHSLEPCAVHEVER